MKQLFSGNPQSEWGNKIIKDLVFIKRKGRYPITYKVYSPLGSVFLLLTISFPVLINGISNANGMAKFALAGMLFCMFVGVSTSLYQLFQVFSFRKIQTAFHLQANQDMLKKFLQSQHLAFTQHPDAPEVFMILSKNLSMRGDFREVMIFITDDKQILVNSHFSGNKLFITPPSKHYKQMANRLREWIKIHATAPTSQSVTLTQN